VQWTHAFVLDQATESSLLPRFINHSCRGANTQICFVELRKDIANSEEDSFIMLAVFAARAIEARAPCFPSFQICDRRKSLCATPEGILTMDYDWTDINPEQFVLCFCEECNGNNIIGRPSRYADVQAFISSKGQVRRLTAAAGAPSSSEGEGTAPRADGDGDGDGDGNGNGNDAIEVGDGDCETVAMDSHQWNRAKGKVWPPRTDDPQTEDEIEDSNAAQLDGPTPGPPQFSLRVGSRRRVGEISFSVNTRLATLSSS
jgi:hypothetical protein